LRCFTYDNLTAIKGEGKSGAFFIFTKDKQFILKTTTAEERDFLWYILPYYWQHMRRNPDSLLPRFYGIYSFKHEGPGGVTRFVIMNNIFSTPYEPVEKYDLKGSSVGRTVSKKKEGAILKDKDITRKLYLPVECHQTFISQLEKDSQFLATHRVMDYSLLLGVYYPTEQNKKKVEENIRKRKEPGTYIVSLRQNHFQTYFNGIRTMNEEGGEEIYFIGIIDILIEYATKKKMEHMFKSIAYDAEEVSVVDPEFYRNRFFKFITGLLSEPKMILDKKEKPESSSSETSSEDEITIRTEEGEKTKPKELEKPKKVDNKQNSVPTSIIKPKPK